MLILPASEWCFGRRSSTQHKTPDSRSFRQLREHVSQNRFQTAAALCPSAVEKPTSQPNNLLSLGSLILTPILSLSQSAPNHFATGRPVVGKWPGALYKREVPTSVLSAVIAEIWRNPCCDTSVWERMGGVRGAEGSGWPWRNLVLGCQSVCVQVYMPVGS